MRIWSLHPKYLDTKGLLALWRETLLAQKVLLGETKGYKNHPQLERFKATEDPIGAIGEYLLQVHLEALNRGYSFDKEKIVKTNLLSPIEVTTGQVAYELQHLLKKLAVRDPERHTIVSMTIDITLHPIFTLIDGPIAPWEKII